MSIDIQRLKIDPAYWDEVAPEGATHALNRIGALSYYKFRMMNYGHTYDLLTDGGRVVKNFDFYRDMPHESDIALFRRPEVSTASLISDERAAEIGQKHDAHKPRHSLLPVGSVASIIDVLEFGARKYGADNWQSVPDARTRYYDAAMRHLGAWWGGERLDAESGLPHLAHAACCILFLMWGDK